MDISRVRRHVITVAMAALLLYSGWELAGIFSDSLRSRAALEETQNLFYSGDVSSGDGNVTGEPIQIEQGFGERNVRSRFHALIAQNDDIVGWVKIDGTPVNHPIVQAEDNVYYLTRNYKREKSRSGSIFMDYRNDLGKPNRNLILYGHRMRDNSMFGSLGNYLDEEFFRAHWTFEFETIYDKYDVEVFSVYLTPPDFNYIKTDFADDQEYQDFLREIHGKSLYETDLDVTSVEQILTLSTCDYSHAPYEGRLVVHAKIKNSFPLPQQ